VAVVRGLDNSGRCWIVIGGGSEEFGRTTMTIFPVFRYLHRCSATNFPC
jgi:hypothetical protein